MAEIVGIFAASHTPVMLNFAELAAEPDRLAAFEAFKELGNAIVASRPDVLVVLSDDHLHNFFLNNLPPFCIGAAESYQTPAEHWLKAPKLRMPGHGDLGAYLIHAAYEADFDPALSMELILDHGIVTPLQLAGFANDVPIVPILINCVQPPMPTMRRSYDFGVMLGRALRACPIVDRVAILATGGISHDVATPRMGLVNEAFDRRFLELMAAGDSGGAISFAADNVNSAGNGAEEVRMWLAAVGAAGSAPFVERFYRPMEGWYTGIGLGAWRLTA